MWSVLFKVFSAVSLSSTSETHCYRLLYQLAKFPHIECFLKHPPALEGTHKASWAHSFWHLPLPPAPGPPGGPATTTQHPCPHHQVEVLLPLPRPGLPGHQRNLAVILNQELDASIFTTRYHSPLGCPNIAPASWDIITAMHPWVLARTHGFISAPYETMRTC